jgi:hypothetical protein
MAGRPTDYREEYNLQVEKLCKLGATDAEIANFFEVDEATINRWKIVHTEFCESIKRGKILADAEVADSLYKKAIGFTNEEVKIFQSDGKPLIVPFTAYYPPDTAAINIWLKNRRGRVGKGAQRWADKVETGFTDNDGNDVPVTIFQLPNNGRSQTEDNTATGRVSDENPGQSG